MAEVLELYRWAVQDPETHVEVLRRMYARLRPGREPRVLREDFAGTSAEAVAWVAAGDGREAVAVDLDAGTLDWARRRAERILGARATAVRFVVGDARAVGPPAVPTADVTAALNYGVLHLLDHAALLAYLKNALRGLAPGGVMAMNLFGGPGSVALGVTRHEVTPARRSPTGVSDVPVPEPFVYEWEVLAFEPKTSRIECAIHFETRGADGAAIRHPRAFTYSWRLWSVGELIGACTHAGFRSVHLWRHTFDARGVYLGAVRPETLKSMDRWNAYVVAGR